MRNTERHKPAGERLTELREARGLTKQALADAVHCSRSAISLYERGKREPKSGVAFRLWLLTKKWGAPIEPPEWERCA